MAKETWVRNGRRRAHAAASLVVACLALSIAWTERALAEQGARGAGASGTCTLESGPRRSVVRVVDSETLVLDDGLEVRLIGALAPRPPGGDAGGTLWLPEIEARAALERLVAGRTVELAFGGQRSDRYGRLLAHVFTERDGERVWVQGRMLAEGQARAYVLPQSAACAAELMAHEALARGVRSGLWSNAAYRLRSAARVGELMRLRGTFQIVEGVVERATHVRGRLYLNFGADWRSDFSVGVAGGVLRGDGAGIAQLEGRRIRVRGWIERRNGPFIELAHSGLIEVLGESDPSVAGARTRGDAAKDSVSGETGDSVVAPPESKRRPARDVPGAVEL